MKKQNVLALVKKAVRGDRQAFVDLCEMKAREVLFLCSREMGNSQDGQDAAQEVFIRMQKNITRLSAPEAFNVWLNRVVFTTCQNQKRELMKQRLDVPIDGTPVGDLPDIEGIPQVLLESREKREWLLSLVDQLPEKYRRCVVLHYFQNLSYSQIAEVTGTTSDAVNHNLRMARKHLRLEIEDAGEAPAAGASAGGAAMALVAFGPAMGQVLAEASAGISLTAVQAALAGAGVAAAAGVAGVAGAAGAAAGAAGAAGGGLLGSVAAKVAAVVLAGSLVTGGAAIVVHNNSPSTPAHVASQPAGLPQAGQAQTALDPPQSQMPGMVTQYGVVEAPAQAQDALLSGRVTLWQDEVLDPAAETGLEGMELEVIDEDGEVAATLLTGPDGLYEVNGLAPGSYRLRLALPQGAAMAASSPTKTKRAAGVFSQTAVWVLFGENGRLEVGEEEATFHSGADIELDWPAVLGGRIQLYENGAPITYDEALLPGVSMQLLDPDGAQVAESAITGEGYYLFRRAMVNRRGSYTLHVEAEPNAEIVLDIEDVEIDLYPGYGLE